MGPGFSTRTFCVTWASTDLLGFSILVCIMEARLLASPRLYLSSENIGVTHEQWALLCTSDHTLASPPQATPLWQPGWFLLGPNPAHQTCALFSSPGSSFQEKVGHLSE